MNHSAFAFCIWRFDEVAGFVLLFLMFYSSIVLKTYWHITGLKKRACGSSKYAEFSC